MPRPAGRLTQCLRLVEGRGWGWLPTGRVEAFSAAGFVATVQVITAIWPSAGIAVKAVTTSELRAVHIHAGTHAHTHSIKYVLHQTELHKYSIVVI